MLTATLGVQLPPSRPPGASSKEPGESVTCPKCPRLGRWESENLWYCSVHGYFCYRDKCRHYHLVDEAVEHETS